MADRIWFWQRIVSPHMTGLAEALATRGREVTYVAEQPMSADRIAQGWRPPPVPATHLYFAPDANAVVDLVAEAPEESIHICQGLRGNGLVGLASRALARRGLRQWIVMETVQEHGRAASWIKRLEYARLIRLWRERIEGVLAIGHAMPGWVVARGMPSERVFPFAYFLHQRQRLTQPSYSPASPFRFLFVGRMIELKRLDVLIDALAQLRAFPFELAIVGSGPLERELQTHAQVKLGSRAIWLGPRPIDAIPALMAQADCLVLPSRHDGWGAVVSEALMVGTPTICSDRCGAAAAVWASGQGGVFPTYDKEALTRLLRDAICEGRQTPNRRAALAAWAQCLSATAGADYLEAVLSHMGGGAKPQPPWRAGGETSVEESVGPS